jgi:hypothetical protein
MCLIELKISKDASNQALKGKTVTIKNTFITFQNKTLFYLVLLAVGIAGCFALLRSTPYGMGLVSDSASYVDGAGNLLGGKGYTRTSSNGVFKPITHFPPMFSITLIPLHLAGLDMLQSGRTLIVLLFGMDIILIGLLTYQISHSILVSLLAAILLAFSNILLEVYAYLLSEPLFITLMLASFFFLSKYFDMRSRRWLILTGLTGCLAYLTRYVGLSLIASLGLTIFLLETDWVSLKAGLPDPATIENSSIIRRIMLKITAVPVKEMAIFLGACLPLILVWTIYTYFVNGGVGNRTLVWHPIAYVNLVTELKSLLNWLALTDLLKVLTPWGRILRLFSLLLVPGLSLYLLSRVVLKFNGDQSRIKTTSETTLAFSVGMQVVLYLLLLAASISLFDASTPLNSRLLSVAYVPLIILFCSGLSWLVNAASKYLGKFGWVLKLTTVSVGLALIFITVKQGIIEINKLSGDGQGYANRAAVNSQIMRDLRDMPPGLIYSNQTNMIFLLTGKPSTITPTPVDPVTTLVRPNFLKDVNTLHEEVSHGQAILVLFNMKNTGDASKDALYKILTTGLKLRKDYGNAQIFAGIN